MIFKSPTGTVWTVFHMLCFSERKLPWYWNVLKYILYVLLEIDSWLSRLPRRILPDKLYQKYRLWTTKKSFGRT